MPAYLLKFKEDKEPVGMIVCPRKDLVFVSDVYCDPGDLDVLPIQAALFVSDPEGARVEYPETIEGEWKDLTDYCAGAE